jgi:hypothetical protein
MLIPSIAAAVATQELISAGTFTSQVYRSEYAAASAPSYVINSFKVNPPRRTIGSSDHVAARDRSLALMPSRTMSVFGPELEPSRNFMEVRATEAAEVPTAYGAAIGLNRHGGSKPGMVAGEEALP